MDKYYNCVYSERTGVLDYFNDNDICIVCEYANCVEKSKALTTQLREDTKILLEEGVLFNQTADFFSGFELVMKKALDKKSVFMDTFVRSHNDMKFKRLINTDCRQTSGWGGDMKLLLEDLTAFCEADYTTILLAGSEKTLPILVRDLNDSGINAEILSEDSELLPSKVYVRTGSVSGGFEYPDIKCAMLTQMKALDSKKKKAPKRPENSKRINSIADITAGDLVVHSMYGIGRFAGIRNLETNGIKKDYITIKYAGTDVLYVPVTQLDLVSKYIAPGDEERVKLNKLSSLTQYINIVAPQIAQVKTLLEVVQKWAEESEIPRKCFVRLSTVKYYSDSPGTYKAWMYEYDAENKVLKSLIPQKDAPKEVIE